MQEISLSPPLFLPFPIPLLPHSTPFSKRFLPAKTTLCKVKRWHRCSTNYSTGAYACEVPKDLEMHYQRKRTNISRVREGWKREGGAKYPLHIRDVKGNGDRKRKKGKREARCRVGDGLLFNGDSKTTLISNATSVSCARASADCWLLTILKGMLGRRENRQPLSTDIVGNL